MLEIKQALRFIQLLVLLSVFQWVPHTLPVSLIPVRRRLLMTTLNYKMSHDVS